MAEQEQLKCYQQIDARTDRPTTNKAGYTATPVVCGWAGAVFEITKSFEQEQ